MVFLDIRSLVKLSESFSKWRCEVSNQFVSISYSFEGYSNVTVTFQGLSQIILHSVLVIELCLSWSPKAIFPWPHWFYMLTFYVFFRQYNEMRWVYICIYLLFIWMNIYIKYTCAYAHMCMKGHLSLNQFVHGQSNKLQFQGLFL